MALSSTDPKVLMGEAKCFSCLTPKQQFVLQTYLLTLIGMGDTSAAGVQALSSGSTCYNCFTHGELVAMKQYLLALWLGLDTSQAGIRALAKTAACDYACLTSKQQQQVETYLLSITAGSGTDRAGVILAEAAARCFGCLETKQQLMAQVYLLSLIVPGAPSTPAAIMAAAKCFLTCVPAELHEAFNASLITQAAGRSTPPCVTPTAPTSVQASPTHVADPNTQLSVRWLQSSNSGSLITGYEVFWGTTAGGPYSNNSGVLPASPKLYTITGLTAGTTYYIVIQALTSMAGCVSANSAETNGTTSGSSTCAAGVTFASAWATRVVANGGAAPSVITQNAIAAFQCGLITDGLDTLMHSWNAFVPDSLIAAITPQLIDSTGGQNGNPSLNPWTNHNFVAGDLTINGLIGNGTTKWLDTGVQPQNAFSSTTNVGITGYITVINTTGVFAGCDNGLGSECISMNDNYYSACAVANAISGGAANFVGYASANVVAGGNGNIYRASSVLAHQSVASGTLGQGALTVQPYTLSAFAFTNNTGQSGFCNGRLSFLAIHKGLSSAQSLALFNRIQTLRTALGGGFI